MQKRANLRLPPEINRTLYIRNLPYKITGEEMYDIFGKYGAIRQIRVGNTPDTRGKWKRIEFISSLISVYLGTAFVVYEDIFDAKNACDHLSGFNVCNRYLVVLYYQANKAFDKINLDKEKEKLAKTQAKFGLNTWLICTMCEVFYCCCCCIWNISKKTIWWKKKKTFLFHACVLQRCKYWSVSFI